MRKVLFFFFCLLNHPQTFAHSDPTRSLLHILDYVSADYPYAVHQGKVIQPSEYNEQLDFIRQSEELLPIFLDSLPSDIRILGQQLLQQAKLHVENKQPIDSLRPVLEELRRLILNNTTVSLFPLSIPDPKRGKNVYVTTCSRCHGSGGKGDGPESANLSPKPQNLLDENKVFSLSPLSIFHTIRLGVSGTSMRPHPQLSDQQVWDVTAYVLSLSYSPNHARIIPSDSFPLSYEQYATLSHSQLVSSLGMDSQTIAGIRLFSPVLSLNQQKMDLIRGMEEVVSLYMNGRYADAQWMVSDLYFQRIEALESHLTSLPDIKTEMEKIFFDFRSAIRKPGQLDVLKSNLNKMKNCLREIPDESDKSPFSVALLSSSIVFREALEAFLLLTIILSIIHKTGMQYAARYLHMGWIIALSLGGISWFLVGNLIAEYMSHVEVMEGVISLLSVGVLLYIGFWLHRRSSIQEWTKYIQDKVSNNLFRNNHFGIFALSFMIVFREVFESLLFLSSLQVQSAGKQTEFVFGGALVALLLVGVLGFVTIRFSLKLPIPKLFFWSMMMMAVLALILTGKGVHAFQEAGIISSHSLSIPSFAFIGLFPYWETLSAQFIVGLIILALRIKGR